MFCFFRNRGGACVVLVALKVTSHALAVSSRQLEPRGLEDGHFLPFFVDNLLQKDTALHGWHYVQSLPYVALH